MDATDDTEAPVLEQQSEDFGYVPSESAYHSSPQGYVPSVRGGSQSPYLSQSC